jgi:hypothetical protein
MDDTWKFLFFMIIGVFICILIWGDVGKDDDDDNFYGY